MKKLLLLLIVTSPQLFSDEYIYLDCGEPDQVFERQYTLLRVFPNKSIDLLDKNLNWKNGEGLVNLEEYIAFGVFGMYELKRDSLELKIFPNDDLSKIHTCQKTSKQKVEAEIESIKSFKRSKQII